MHLLSPGVKQHIELVLERWHQDSLRTVLSICSVEVLPQSLHGIVEATAQHLFQGILKQMALACRDLESSADEHGSIEIFGLPTLIQLLQVMKQLPPLTLRILLSFATIQPFYPQPLSKAERGSMNQLESRRSHAQSSCVCIN